jgi:hypothetical protein
MNTDLQQIIHRNNIGARRIPAFQVQPPLHDVIFEDGRMEWRLPRPESLELQPQGISNLEIQLGFLNWMTTTLAAVTRVLLQKSLQHVFQKLLDAKKCMRIRHVLRNTVWMNVGVFAQKLSVWISYMY